jgi:putative sigma-54 modulation protein
MRQHDVILSGHHIELTDALKSVVHEKVEKLFQHEDRIIRLRVDLEYKNNGNRDKEYIAKGHIEISGPPLILSVSSDDLYKSIDEMVDKLDRKLRRRSRLRKVKRNNPHGIDIPADLPKVSAA